METRHAEAVEKAKRNPVDSRMQEMATLSHQFRNYLRAEFPEFAAKVA